MLEAVAVRPHGAADAVRLGVHALLSDIFGDWRSDPAVQVTALRSGVIRADRGHVHAILDGEPMRLGRQVEFDFVPLAFRALAPPGATASPPAAALG
jgi:diacylglycerol kinase family enzyme